MKKLSLVILLITASLFSKSQVIWNMSQMNYGPYPFAIVATPDDYNTVYPVAGYLDTSLYYIYSDSVIINKLNSTYNHGTPTSIVWTDNSGLLRRSPIASIPYPDNSATNELELPSQTGNNGKVLKTNGTAASWETVPNPITYYNQSGSVSAPTKKISFIATPNTGDGYSIDISAAGFSSIYSYSVVAIKNTGTATSVPKISIKSTSTSAIVVNIIEGNANTVNILGNLVSLGATESFANTSGLTLMVTVEGN